MFSSFCWPCDDGHDDLIPSLHLSLFHPGALIILMPNLSATPDMASVGRYFEPGFAGWDEHEAVFFK